MLFVISFLLLATFIQGNFVRLRNDLQKINQLEEMISKIKYIQGVKISFDLMPIVTEFDLFCDKEFLQQSTSLTTNEQKAWICWNKIVLLWNKKTPYLEYSEFEMVQRLLYNWNELKKQKYQNLKGQWVHVHQEYINLKVVLLDIIHSYVDYEKQLEELYIRQLNRRVGNDNDKIKYESVKYESKENIIKLMGESIL
jgi:protein-tyrosine phosphatase